MNRFFALVLMAFGFAGAARADFISATWVDVSPEASNQYIGNGQSFSYTHDLTDNGFRPLNDLITSFQLSLNLADNESNNKFEVGLWELDLFPISGQGNSFVKNFGLGGSTGGFSILGLLQLNTLGSLTVTISSIVGDFTLVSSTLTATGKTANVPEPGALGLLGLGLVGVALSKRRRKQAAQA